MLLMCPEDRGFKVKIPPVASPRHVATLTSASACPQQKGLPHQGIFLLPGSACILSLGARLLWHDCSPIPNHFTVFRRHSGNSTEMDASGPQRPCNPRAVLKVEYES